MMRSPTYYEVLGLTPSASSEEIKKRYRELARRYHPDVARMSDAAEKFKAINEANRVLSDPQRRAGYDAELRLARIKEQETKNGKTTSNGSSRPVPTPSRPASTPPRPASSPQRPASHAPRSSARAQRPPTASAERLVAEAQRAFTLLNLVEAESLCRQVLNLDRRNAGAYEILGDIHRRRGHPEEALAMYSYALQLDRNNRSVQTKFDRLASRTSGPKPSGPTTRPATASRPRPRPAEPRSRPAETRSTPAAPKRSTPRLLVNGIGGALLVFLLIAVALLHDPPATTALIPEWDPLALLALAISGMTGGLLLSVNDRLDRVRNEMIVQETGRSRTFSVPLGAALLLFALVFFYASFLIYLLFGLLQGGTSRSILRAFAASFGLVALFTLAGHTGALFIFLLGGNLVFPGFIVGWAMGDALRP